jgi:hypothetical protein
MGTQTTIAGPTPGTASPVNAYQAIFNAAYYKSKPPAKQPLYNGRPGSANPGALPLTQDEAWALVGQLIAQGYTIDEEIDAEGMDPYTVMFMRQQYGQTWEPAGLGAVKVTNVSQSGAVVTQGMYTGAGPAGQIKVSTLLEDYPPYPVPVADAPVVHPIPQAPNPIGIRIIAQVPAAINYVGDVFRCALANDGFAIGDTWNGKSGSFSGEWTKQALLFGTMIVWTKTK